jgi:hypothetical protein
MQYAGFSMNIITPVVKQKDRHRFPEILEL